MSEAFKTFLSGIIHLVLFFALVIALFQLLENLTQDEFSALAFGCSIMSTAVHMYTLRFTDIISHKDFTKVVFVSAISTLPCVLVAITCIKFFPIESIAIFVPLSSAGFTKIVEKSVIRAKIGS